MAKLWELISLGTLFVYLLRHSVPLQVMANGPPPGLMNLKESIGKQDTKAAGNQSILVKYVRIARGRIDVGMEPST